MENYLFKSKIDIFFRYFPKGEHVLVSPCSKALNVIIMNGAEELSLSIGGKDRMHLMPYSLFVVGRDSVASIFVPEGGQCIALFFDYIGRYCDAKICAFLENNPDAFSNEYSSMPMDEGLKGYFITMSSSLVDLFDEVPFCEIKYKEFFFILCNMLDIASFSKFLHPAMSWYDPVFRRKVMDNYAKSYRVKALASDCGYSEKDFVRKFKDEFGMMPGKWINDQVSRSIVKKLSNPNIAFKELADDLHMSSVQSFSRFCKRNFKKTPSELRRELIDQ